MSVVFALTPGVPATPSHFRATNVPSIELFTMCGWFQIDNYENFFQFIAIENGGAGRVTFVEGDAAGQLKLVRSGAGTTEVNYWADAYTGWAFVSAVGTVATVAGFYQRLGGAWTASPTITSLAGANTYLGNVTASFDTDVNGDYKRLAYKIWNISLTEAELKAEVWSVEPVKWSGLTFWDHGLIPAACNVDRSGTGGTMTLAGAPGSSPATPGLPWRALRAYGY